MLAVLVAMVLMGGMLALCCCTGNPAGTTSSTAPVAAVHAGHSGVGDTYPIRANVLHNSVAAVQSLPDLARDDGGFAAVARPSTEVRSDEAPDPAGRGGAAQAIDTAVTGCEPSMLTPTGEAGWAARPLLYALSSSPPVPVAMVLAAEFDAPTPRDVASPAPRPSPYVLCVIRT